MIRMIDHCVIPQLCVYLLDHERDEIELFSKLKSKTYNLYLVVHMVDQNERSFVWK